MVNVKVDLGKNSYPIFIGEGTLAKIGEMLELYGFTHEIIIISDATVAELYSEQLSHGLKRHCTVLGMLTVPAGEPSKSMAVVERLVTEMLEMKATRAAVVLALGGGVLGDIVGFTAAIYKRGIPYIQIPTTLLAQVDSSIGGKTGVNHPLGKNQIGAIHQPKLVWTDLAFLKSLPRREIICGMGEIVKYAILGDPRLFDLLEAELDAVLALDPDLLTGIVEKCSRMKADIVSKDERENGLRRVLNLGHTVGHGFEGALGYGKISHGEAVLLGTLAEAKIARDIGLLAAGDFGRIEKLVSRFGLQAALKDVDSDKVLELMGSDKKAVAGKSRFALPKEIGEVEIVEDVPLTKIRSGIEFVSGKG